VLPAIELTDMNWKNMNNDTINNLFDILYSYFLYLILNWILIF